MDALEWFGPVCPDLPWSALCHTEKIVVRSVAGERYDRIVGYKLGALPEEIPVWNDTFDEEEVPF